MPQSNAPKQGWLAHYSELLGAWTLPALAGEFALACCALLAFFIADPAGWLHSPSYQQEFRTAYGERRQVILPDNSLLELNTNTVATGKLYKDKRSVQLVQGEILFNVEGRQGTPFFVEMESGTVRVTGTQFNVRRQHSDAFAVGVLEGSVEVETGPWWRRKTVALGAGDAASSPEEGRINVQNDADVESTVAWRDGKVVFRGTPLAEAVKEVNRYTQHKLLVADAKAGRLRVSGVFSIDDPAAFIEALPRIVPVAVQARSSGVMEIVLQ